MNWIEDESHFVTRIKLLKQNLQVKTFLGTSENACKSQMSAYRLVNTIRHYDQKGRYQSGLEEYHKDHEHSDHTNHCNPYR